MTLASGRPDGATGRPHGATKTPGGVLAVIPLPEGQGDTSGRKDGPISGGRKLVISIDSDNGAARNGLCGDACPTCSRVCERNAGHDQNPGKSSKEHLHEFEYSSRMRSTGAFIVTVTHRWSPAEVPP